MNNILVTGGTGFIGSHLLPVLYEKNLQVTLAARYHISDALDPELKVVKIGEINESTDWTEALKEVDIVIHLAARAHQLNDQAINPEAEFLTS